jgi:hypothetical protein
MAPKLSEKLSEFKLPKLRNPLLRQEMPWLISEVVLLIILFNANAPELWFWLVVLIVILAYRIERWHSSKPS